MFRVHFAASKWPEILVKQHCFKCMNQLHLKYWNQSTKYPSHVYFMKTFQENTKDMTWCPQC